MTTALSPQERMARECLAQGRFRKAREEFKLLCKVDRPKFQPLLVEANLGLAREMFAKGMVGETRQLIVYLKTIASPEQVLALELELGLAVSTAGAGTLAPSILDLLAKPSLEETERRRLADCAVLAFEPVPNPRPELAGLATELEAMAAALRAISERNFERALEQVRPLGQSSLFSQWKGLVKGLCAFYRGEREKAARFLAELPATFAPGKAAQPFLLLLGKLPLAKDAPPPAEPVVEAAARLLGQTGWGAPLLRAEEAWRKRNPTQMYRALRTALRGFPAEGADLLGMLSEFAVNCLFTLPFELRDRYLDLVEDIATEECAATLVERLLFLRAAVLAEVAVMPDDLAIQYWEEFLRLHRQLHGANPALESAAYAWLGKVMSQPPGAGPSPFFPSPARHRKLRNGPQAERLLQRAVALDSNNLSACLSLCEVYHQQRQPAERNRLLDVMAARFSTDKRVLLLAGEACLERKVFKKGLDYLLHALSLDRLDPAVPNQVVKAYLLQAREFFRKKRPQDARKALDQAARFAVDAPDNLARSRWCLNLHRGVLESTWGEPGQGSALLDEARRASPSVAAFLYYAGFVVQTLGRRGAGTTDYFAALQRLARTGATAAEAVLLTRIWQQFQDWLPENTVYKARTTLEDYLEGAARHPFAREDAGRLVEFALAEESYPFLEAVLELVETQLQRDVQDPLFRLHRCRLLNALFGPGRAEERAELEAILAEAGRRKDEATARQARKLLDALATAPPPPPFPFEADFSEEEPPDFEAEFPSPEELFAGISPAQRGMMEELMAMIARASAQELKELRRTMPPGMKGEEFELLVKLARGMRSLPGAGLPPVNLPLPKPPPLQPPKPPKPPKASPRPDPNQPDLF